MLRSASCEKNGPLKKDFDTGIIIESNEKKTP